MQVWTTREPLTLPIEFSSVRRLDLEFTDVRRDRGTFTSFVFVTDDPVPVPMGAGRDCASFVGSFTIFAPSECWGVDDHCDWRKGPLTAFDRRPPHHLAPINVTMEVTEVVSRLPASDQLFVTVHSARRTDPDLDEGVFLFRDLLALAYQ
jgi:hypothetical protein